MWMRVVSSWLCILLYTWSLLAPVLMPDRCVTPPMCPPLSSSNVLTQFSLTDLVITEIWGDRAGYNEASVVLAFLL